MKNTLALAALLATTFMTAQTRWDYELGARTPPPQGGMFGTFWNYQFMIKASPRKATAEAGSGRWALRLRTGQNTLSFNQSPNNSSFWINSQSMLGVERLGRRGTKLKSYWGAELGGSVGAYQSMSGSNLSIAPSASLLFGLRYQLRPRWTLSAEVAPTVSRWYAKYNEAWQEPSTQFMLSGQSIGLIASYRL